MKNQMQLNALTALAGECNKSLCKHKAKVRKMSGNTIRELMKPFSDKAVLIGFSGTEFIHKLGQLNGKFGDRR